MMDDLILLDVSGDMIHKVSKHFISLRTWREILWLRLMSNINYQALENGVSMWPKLEGRFPQVSFLRAIKAFSEALLSISVNSFKMSNKSVFLLPLRWAGSHLPLTQKSRRDQESTQSLSRWFFIFFLSSWPFTLFSIITLGCSTPKVANAIVLHLDLSVW